MRHFWLELSSASKLFFFFWIVQSMLWSLTMCLVIHPMFCNLTCNLVTSWIKISLYNWLIVLWLVISLEQISNKLDKNICKLFDLTISSSSTDVQRSFFFFFLVSLWWGGGGVGRCSSSLFVPDESSFLIGSTWTDNEWMHIIRELKKTRRLIWLLAKLDWCIFYAVYCSWNYGLTLQQKPSLQRSRYWRECTCELCLVKYILRYALV